MSGPVDRLRAAAPGQRWVVRVRLADGSATDIVGWVVGTATDAVLLSGPLAADAAAGTDAEQHVVPYAVVLAARRAPAAAGGPAPGRTTAAVLEHLAAPAWAAETQPLGEWVLRAGGGFSGRANSCLAVGDPGLPYPDAAARVEAYAAASGIAPLAQVVSGSEQDHALRARGWVESYVATDVLAVRLADLLEGRDPDPRVVVEETLTPGWRAAYDESRPSTVDPAAVTAILEGRPPRAFASVPGDGGPGDGEPGDGGPGGGGLRAIARGHLGGTWLGLAAIWTRPDLRRQGLATALMTGLGHWAARRGARYAYLQVAAANEGAHAAYARLGFTAHHSYHYLAPPGVPDEQLSGR